LETMFLFYKFWLNLSMNFTIVKLLFKKFIDVKKKKKVK